MKEFRGRVAVITGAASGIGFALAERAANEGMTVVLCDVEAGALDRAVGGLKERGFPVHGRQLDVSDADAVDALAGEVFERFGGCHLLCNNAGVYISGQAAWEHSLADWKWLLDVNLWGVIHGLRAFVPRMLASGAEGHIVNTASMAGLITGGLGTAVYDASKHAVLSLSESLYRDLAVRTSKVSASVLCPGAVNTNIFASERNRPGGQEAAQSTPGVPGSAIPGEAFPPAKMADEVFSAVEEGRFYVLAAQTAIYEWTKMGHDRMWEGKNPAVARRLIAAREAAGN